MLDNIPMCILVIIVVIAYLCLCDNKQNAKKTKSETEKFENVPIDTEVVKNWGGIAKQLLDGGVNIPGNLVAKGAASADKLSIGQPLPDNNWRSANFKRQDGRWTHLDWMGDGKNYFRGDTQVDGNLKVRLGDTTVFETIDAGSIIGPKDKKTNNDWILHTPGDDRKLLYVAPKRRDGKDWDWSKQTIFNGDNGNINAAGTITGNKGDGWGSAINVNAPQQPESLYSLHFGDGSDLHGRQAGMGYIKGQPKKLFGDTRGTLGMHVHEADDFQIYSSGWNPLFGVKGGTGNVKATGSITGSKGSGWGSAINVNAPQEQESLYALHFGDGSDLHGRQCGMGYIKGQPNKLFGDTRGTLGMHVHESDDFQIYSSGWDPLFGVKGKSGDVKVKGQLCLGGTCIVEDDLKRYKNVMPKGYINIVNRRPIFGIGMKTSQNVFNGTDPQLLVQNITYGPFGYNVPPVAPGATRKFRLYAVYSDNITGGPGPIIRVSIYNGAWKEQGKYVDFQFPLTWGGTDETRDAFSNIVDDPKDGMHGLVYTLTSDKSTFTVGSKTTAVRWQYVEIQALDVYN